MRAKKAKKEKNTLKRKSLKPGIILSPKYWKDQQRGCLEHCANNPLYGRHMNPFFAEIRAGMYNFTMLLTYYFDFSKSGKGVVIEVYSYMIDWGTEARALLLPELVPVEDAFPTQISISTRSGLGLNTRMAAEPHKSTATDQNIVLFVSS